MWARWRTRSIGSSNGSRSGLSVTAPSSTDARGIVDAELVQGPRAREPREARVTDAAGYDAWYGTARGAWIGNLEFHLLQRLLRPEQGETLLDVGCGTGYFTRRFAGESGVHAVGVDPNPLWLDYARTHGFGTERYCLGRAEALPFADGSFDRTVSVTALCFVEDARRALDQMLRVTRKRFAVGLLNRHSLLYLQKGRLGGSGAYRGAHWHTQDEIHALLDELPARNVTIETAVLLSSGGPIARGVELLASGRLPFGAFIVIAGDVSRQSRPIM
ncbi:MAG: class I SAM-dependent methyltransferase [Betaproteobacteria bacterium]|nr:class I SAM-dependent methyltransferase [Betaproteobacteria bacterium]MDE2210860.1 class I SAM-dependent methyltransferase [Betaproteobacteria bacterium]MDE2361002.1 class I SAM-dependent methyltransferase [Betaproteobacteria bacterium]